MPPRNFLRDSLGFAVAQYVIRVLLMVRAVVAVRLLGPLPDGAWNALQLVMDYGTTLPPMGTQRRIDQAVPARIIEGDPDRLARLERAGQPPPGFQLLRLNPALAIHVRQGRP